MSLIEIEDIDNECSLQPCKSEVDIPRSKLSVYFYEDVKEVSSQKQTFTTEIQPAFTQLGNKVAKSPDDICKYGLFRSLSLSKPVFIQNSPLMGFKKSAYINNITNVNKFANISPLFSKRSSHVKPKLSTRINILKLSTTANKRKLTSNQISDVLKPRVLGEAEGRYKNSFATQIIKQTIREVDEENNCNDVSSHGSEGDNVHTTNNQYIINIIQPQKSSTVEFENIKKQIMQTAKCAYAKTFSEFYGFAAFTFKTTNEVFLDKMDIVLNKELHHNSSPMNLCHCFGVFPYMNNEHISLLLKERFHKHLLRRKDITFNPVNAFFDTFIHFDKKLSHHSNLHANTPLVFSLLIMNSHIYIVNNSLSKCIAFNSSNMNISTLTKTQSTLNAIKEDFREKKQQFQYNATSNKSLSQTITLKSLSLHSPHSPYDPIVTELSLANLAQQDQIDFIVVVNENVSNVLSNKDIVLAILTSLLSNTISYERSLETAIDSICIEAAKKNAKFPLSVVFLPMKGYYTLVSQLQKEENVNEMLVKLKAQMGNDECFHNAGVVYKDNRNGKKTSAITVHNHLRCKLSKHSVDEYKNNEDSSSMSSNYSKSGSCGSGDYQDGGKYKKGKKMFCGCFS